MSYLREQQNLSEHNSLLKNAVSTVKNSLQNFANLPGFDEQMMLAFGDDVNIDECQAHWQTGNFTFPAIEIVSAITINGANGAFSSDTDTIYLSAEFLAANQSNLDFVNAVLLEEYGRYLDSKLNLVDSPGDEGAIFSALVHGEELSDRELQQLRSEDDSAVVTIDEESIAIEQNIEDITLYSDSINFNQNGEFDFDFQTADYINRWAGFDISNNYTYSSGNDFIPRLNFGGDTYSIGGGFDIGVASLGANAGLRVAPGFFEAGLEVNAGYNLGEFSFDFGSLQASINAGIRNNQLDIDINTNIELPDFDYILPYAYANLSVVLGYDFRVDGFVNGRAEVGGGLFGSFGGYEGGFDTNLIDKRSRYERTLVNLDTRSDDNYIDYIVDRINFNSGEGSVPRSRTGGFFDFDFKLPSFENTFEPISFPNSNLPNFNPNFPTIFSPNDEYIWEISEETTLAEASLSLDNLLAQFPILAWLSQAGNEGTNIYGYDFGLEYDWRALVFDLSANLNFGYSFKLGVTDLLPQFDSELSEISSLEFELENVNSLDDLTSLLVDLDDDNGNDIDVYLEYDPTIIFEAEAYLRPQLNFDWDIGLFDSDLVLANRPYGVDFTVLEGEPTNLANTTVDIIAPIKREVKFSEIYRWLTGSQPSFTEYNLEIPFSALNPNMFGNEGDDFFAGSSEDDDYMAGEGNDRVIVSKGSNDILAGDGGIDTLILNRSRTYDVASDTITDDAGNRTEFETFELLALSGIDRKFGIQASPF